MATFTPNYQIAAGHNNAAGLTAVNLLTDVNGVRLIFPKALPFYEEGELVFRCNATPAYRGYKMQDWKFTVLLNAQYNLLRTTYTGLVTVKTCLDGINFTNWNASAWIDQKTATQPGYLNGSVYDSGFTGPGYREVRLHLILTEAL